DCKSPKPIHLIKFRTSLYSERIRHRTRVTGTLSQLLGFVLSTAVLRTSTLRSTGSASLHSPSPTYTRTCTPVEVTAKSPGESCEALISVMLPKAAIRWVCSSYSDARARPEAAGHTTFPEHATSAG